MYGSEDLNLPFPASTAYDKQGKEESDLFPHDEPINSGLLRYRSAPSTLLHDVGCEALAPNGSTSPEEDSMFAGFMSEKRPAAEQRPPHSSSFQMMFHSPQQQQQHRLSSAPAPAPAVKSLYRMMSSTAEEQAKSGGSSSILRRNTSPAGLFSQLNLDNGFNMLRGTRDGYRHDAASNGESGEATAGMMKGHQISFSPRQGSSGFMSRISEAGSNAVGGGVSSTEDGGGGSRLSNGDVSGAGRRYIPACYPLASWEDPVLLSDGFSGSKRARYPSDLHSGEPRSNHVSNLTHQPSLPTSSLDTPSSMEELQQMEGVVPCQIRAKRGCATHPRSIAERVRRTKISERMKKLQDLVPNMHKQTNTADMLDLAVDYVKDLQKTIQMLSDDRSRCTCTSKQKA